MSSDKYYTLKRVFKCILGRSAYLELKHCSRISVWKKHSVRVLKASLVAFNETLEIKDNYWKIDMHSLVEHGIKQVKDSDNFDELFQGFAATYIELSFHQIGQMPNRIHNRYKQHFENKSGN